MNPFPSIIQMRGRLTRCGLLCYRTPAASVRSLLPPGLDPVTHGRWAFWNVVACRVEGLRPPLVPRPLGLTMNMVAYRLMVQAMTDRGEVVRGLYFVWSDMDSAAAGAVAAMGNQATDLQLHGATVRWDETGDDASLAVCVDGELPADIAVRDAEGDDARVPGSCFATPADARRFLKYPPLAMTAEGDRLRFARVHRDPGQWRERAVAVERARLAFFDEVGQTEHAKLELATRVEPIDYRWTLGETAGLLGGRVQSLDPLAGAVPPALGEPRVARSQVIDRAA